MSIARAFVGCTYRLHVGRQRKATQKGHDGFGQRVLVMSQRVATRLTLLITSQSINLLIKPRI